MSGWYIRPLELEDIPYLAALDFEIESLYHLAVDKEPSGLEMTWRLTVQPLAPPFRSTDLGPKPDELDQMRGHLAAGRHDYFVAAVPSDAEGAEGDRPVALLELKVEKWRNIGVVWNLLVDRAYRRQGLGTALMQLAIEWARSRGLRALVLETQTNNWGALNFYSKMGFRLCAVDDHFYTNRDLEAGEVALFWYYELEGQDAG